MRDATIEEQIEQTKMQHCVCFFILFQRQREQERQKNIVLRSFDRVRSTRARITCINRRHRLR